MTIYSVKKHIAEYFGAFTKPSHGTIHPCIKKLEDYGFLSCREVLSDGGKKSNFYSITEKGKRQFTSLMLSEFSDNPSVFLSEINIRIAAFDILPLKEKENFIQHCIKAIELYQISAQNLISNTYIGLNKIQKELALQSISNTKYLIEIIKRLSI
jgi:DNA-binding PadR family transcriptional regulator